MGLIRRTGSLRDSCLCSTAYARIDHWVLAGEGIQVDVDLPNYNLFLADLVAVPDDEGHAFGLQDLQVIHRGVVLWDSFLVPYDLTNFVALELILVTDFGAARKVIYMVRVDTYLEVLH